VGLNNKNVPSIYKFFVRAWNYDGVTRIVL